MTPDLIKHDMRLLLIRLRNTATSNGSKAEEGRGPFSKRGKKDTLNIDSR